MRIRKALGYNTFAEFRQNFHPFDRLLIPNLLELSNAQEANEQAAQRLQEIIYLLQGVIVGFDD